MEFVRKAVHWVWRPGGVFKKRAWPLQTLGQALPNDGGKRADAPAGLSAVHVSASSTTRLVHAKADERKGKCGVTIFHAQQKKKKKSTAKER